MPLDYLDRAQRAGSPAPVRANGLLHCRVLLLGTLTGGTLVSGVGVWFSSSLPAARGDARGDTAPRLPK